jgi:excisionase family DNA binding protein
MDTAGTLERKKLMKPGEVAALLRVDPKTVTRWASAGKLRSIRTIGGHRRFFSEDIAAIMMGDKNPRDQ